MRQASEESPACLCRATEQSWLRLITTPAVQKSVNSPTFGNTLAIETITRWLSQPQVLMIDEEPPGTRPLWLRLAANVHPSPKLWMDAYLAAFAISANLALVTADQDFRQFEASGLHLLLVTL